MYNIVIGTSPSLYSGEDPGEGEPPNIMRDWSLIMGEGRGATKQEGGGAGHVLPLQKVVGDGHAEGAVGRCLRQF